MDAPGRFWRKNVDFTNQTASESSKLVSGWFQAALKDFDIEKIDSNAEVKVKLLKKTTQPSMGSLSKACWDGVQNLPHGTFAKALEKN